MPRRAVIYTRISSDPKGERAGVQRQETDCRELVERLGWDLVEVYSDDDVSAYSGKRRPGYERLVDDLEAGRVDAVVAWHPDRLYRRLVDLEGLIALVERRRVELRTVTAGEVDLGTPTGRAIARTVATWAAHEVEHNTERLRSQKRDAAASGRYRGSSRPFGYERDGVTVRESEAREVRDATRRLLGGDSLRSIMFDWQARGVPTPKGAVWSMGSVRYVLHRARNAGLVERHGEVVGPAEWPELVTEHEWRGVRALLADPARRTSMSRDRRWLGSGLFLCGRCDNGATVRMGGTGAGSKGRAYRCDTCRLSRQAEPVDEYVKALFVGTDDVEGLLASFKLKVHDTSAADVAALQAEVVSCRELLGELRRALGKREITLQDFKVAAAELEADLETANARLKATASRSPLAGVVDAEDIRAAWAAVSVDKRKAIIDTVSTVALMPARPGRQPGGAYFTPESVRVTPKE
jgi:site-specific DNA recombinase